MKQLKDVMDALEIAISSYNAIIAGGVIATVVGSLVIVVGVLLKLPSGAGHLLLLLAQAPLLLREEVLPLGLRKKKVDTKAYYVFVNLLIV